MHRRDVIIIGGGQAGLAVSYCLTQRNVEHLIVDRGQIGDSWRNRWDSFCLVTPNWQCQLPGHHYDGDDPNGFMTRDEVVAYIEQYASKFAPPFRGGVEVTGVRREKEQFAVSTSEGDWLASSVVVATGLFRQPRIPEFAARAAPSIVQLHSSTYRNPESLPQGAVLIVGSGQSGAQIADELQMAGRRVHLAVGSAGRAQRRYRGRDVLEWAVDLGRYKQTVDEHPRGRMIRFAPHAHLSGRDGGKTIDLRELALRGVHLYGHLEGLEGTTARFRPNLRERLDAADAACWEALEKIDSAIEARGLEAEPPDRLVYDWQPEVELTELDLASAGISTILWASGYRSDFSWLDVPVFDEHGYPRATRGITEIPGLYFVGLHWLHTLGSGLLYGVGADAEHIAESLSNHLQRE